MSVNTTGFSAAELLDAVREATGPVPLTVLQPSRVASLSHKEHSWPIGKENVVAATSAFGGETAPKEEK